MQNQEYQELLNLQNLNLPLTFRVTHRHKRIIIYVQITPKSSISIQRVDMKRNRTYVSNEEQQQNNYVELNNFEENKSSMMQNKQSFREQKQDIQTIVYQQGLHSFESMVFAIILYHEYYPYEPPFVTICNTNIFPYTDQFKDYYYDIMEASTWWPLVTLNEVLARLPNFSYKIFKQYYQDKKKLKIGNYLFSFPLYFQDLKEIASKLFVDDCKIKDKKFMSDKSKIGLTSGCILLFKINKQANAYFIQEFIPIKYICELSQKVSTKYHYFEIVVKREETMTINIKVKVEEVAKINNLLFYLKYYQICKLLQLQNRTHDDKVSLIQQIQMFISINDENGFESSLFWTKKQLQRIMS